MVMLVVSNIGSAVEVAGVGCNTGAAAVVNKNTGAASAAGCCTAADTAELVLRNMAVRNYRSYKIVEFVPDLGWSVETSHYSHILVVAGTVAVADNKVHPRADPDIASLLEPYPTKMPGSYECFLDREG
jgi:roadblock/LC7 domain-containing protein